MADEMHCSEDVISDNSITQQHTSDSQGLHHDHVAEEALGGHTADLGKSYFTSINFIGTVIVCSCPSILPHMLTSNRPHAWRKSQGKHA